MGIPRLEVGPSETGIPSWSLLGISDSCASSRGKDAARGVGPKPQDIVVAPSPGAITREIVG
jgi:hypothetical protein